MALTIDTSASSVCSMNGSGVVSFTSAGTCVIDANQAGNGSYAAAPQVQQSFGVGLAAQTITFTSPATLPTASNKQKTYTAYVDVTGGAGASYTWSITSGSLPTGLSLDPATSSGETMISGNPKSVGTYTFTISVSDGTSTAQATFSITITSH